MESACLRPCVDPGEAPVCSSLQVCAGKLSELTFTIITTLHFITTHGERKLLYKCSTRHVYSNGTKRLEQQNAPKKPNKQNRCRRKRMKSGSCLNLNTLCRACLSSSVSLITVCLQLQSDPRTQLSCRFSAQCMWIDYEVTDF